MRIEDTSSTAGFGAKGAPNANNLVRRAELYMPGHTDDAMSYEMMNMNIRDWLNDSSVFGQIINTMNC